MAQSLTELVTKYSAKAAGVYREIIDATAEIAPVASSSNVVVVGQFETGPIMRPIRVSSADGAHKIFGNRSTRLEAKGNYGMLMAEQVLEQGPIWIMNVKNIDQYTETLQVKQFACSSEETDALLNEPISVVYDTGKFWKVDPMYGIHGDGPVLSFAAVNDNPVTIVIAKYNSQNYMYTIGETKKYNESYSNEDVDDNDFVNDYLVKIYVFKCDLAKAKLSVQNAFIGGKIDLSKIEDICNDINSEYFATYTGAIGDIIDINGNNLNIQSIMNADTTASGVSVAINRDAYALHGVDLLCKDALVFSPSEDALPTGNTVNRLGYTITPKLDKICVYNDSSNQQGYMFGECNLSKGDMIANESGIVRVANVAYVDNSSTLPSGIVLGIVSSTLVEGNYPVMPNGKPLTSKQGNIFVYPNDSIVPGVAIQYSANHLMWPVREFVNTSAEVTYTDTFAAANYSGALVAYTLNGTSKTLQVTITPGIIQQVFAAIETALEEQIDQVASISVVISDNDDTKIVSVTSEVTRGTEAFTLGSITFTTETTETVVAPASVSDKASTASNIQQPVYYPVVVENNATVTYQNVTNEVDYNACAEVFGTSTPIYRVNFDAPISSNVTPQSDQPTISSTTWNTPTLQLIDGQTIEVTPYQFVYYVDWSKSSQLSTVNAIYGIKSLEKHFVNGTAARQKLILDRLNDEGILTAFSDPTIFNCRYMCDTFKTYIEPNVKFQYARLADEAKRFLVFIPAPFYHELRNSKNPDFHDALGAFKMSYVAMGQNPDKPSTNTFSYSKNGDTGRYLYPIMNVMYNVGFGSKVIPATGAICKLFYSKLFGVNKVYDIVAGQDWPISVTGIIGPEFETGPDDRAAMEKMGTNVIQTIDGVLQVRSSKTAYQTVLSAFNYPETMEKCFYVSDNVESILQGKLFKYNNADARLAVKKRADAVCDIMVADGVIADYENKCDLDNNTVEVRKAGIIVLDTILYNEYGITIAVHRTTVKDPQE